MTDPARPALVVNDILHPAERDRFVAACEETDVDAVPELRQRILGHLAHLEASLDEYPVADADSARVLAAALLSALDDAPTLPAEHRALLRGAIEYYIDTSDVDDDLTSPTGFDDDIRVANAVFEVMGRDELIVRP